MRSQDRTVVLALLCAVSFVALMTWAFCQQWNGVDAGQRPAQFSAPIGYTPVAWRLPNGTKLYRIDEHGAATYVGVFATGKKNGNCLLLHDGTKVNPMGFWARTQ